MQLALNQAQVLVTPQQAQLGDELTCPTCGRPVRLVCGSRRRYFRHLSGQSTGAGETTTHLKGKDQLFLKYQQANQQVQTEVSLPQFNRRIDVLVQNKQQQLALEYQCSPISAEQLSQRTHAYYQAGINVRWIFGPRYEQPSRHQHQLMTQWVLNQPCLITMGPPNWMIKYRFISTPANSGWLRMKHEYACLRRLRRATTNDLANLAYQQGHRLWLCPVGLHTLVESWPLTTEPLLMWQIRLLLALERTAPVTTWTLATWQQWVNQHTQWATFPLLTAQQQKKLQQVCLQQLLVHWLANGFLTQQSQKIMRGQINWEKSDEQKWQHLRQVSRQQRPSIDRDRLVMLERGN